MTDIDKYVKISECLVNIFVKVLWKYSFDFVMILFYILDLFHSLEIVSYRNLFSEFYWNTSELQEFSEFAENVLSCRNFFSSEFSVKFFEQPAVKFPSKLQV